MMTELDEIESEAKDLFKEVEIELNVWEKTRNNDKIIEKIQSLQDCLTDFKELISYVSDDEVRVIKRKFIIHMEYELKKINKKISYSSHIEQLDKHTKSDIVSNNENEYLMGDMKKYVELEEVKQDEYLNSIDQSLSRIKEVANNMKVELNMQDVILDELDENIELTSKRIRDGTKDIDSVKSGIEENERNCFGIVACFSCIIIGLLAAIGNL